MPLAIDPQERFTYTLESDKGKPGAPAFQFRYLTARQWRAARGLSEVDDTQDAGDVLDKLYAALGSMIVGWQGIDTPYTAEALQDVTTIAEAWELYYAGMRQGIVTAEQKKTSGSQSDTSVADSAGTAATTPAAAPTGPAPASP